MILPESGPRQLLHKFHCQPWIVLQALLTTNFPSIGTQPLYATWQSTCHLFDLPHPKSTQISFPIIDNLSDFFYLPHWFDAVFENMVVRVTLQLWRPQQVAVEVPKLFHWSKSANQFQVLVVVVNCLLFARCASTEPACVGILKSVFSWGNLQLWLQKSEQ